MSKPKLAETILICCADRNSESGKKWVEVEGRALKGGVFALTRNTGTMGITHIKTGFLVQDYIPSLAAATFAVKRLMALDVDWGFDDPKAVKSFPDDVSKMIHKIKEDAYYGVTKEPAPCTP